MITVTHEGSVSVVRADSVLDLARTLDPAEWPAHNRQKGEWLLADFEADMAGTGTQMAGWYGEEIKSLADARGLLENGWASGAARALALAQSLPRIEAPQLSLRRRLRWADQGSELHLDRALSGDFDTAWRSTHQTPTGAPKVITLVTAFGATHRVSPDKLFYSGAQLIALTDALEDAGYRVEAIAANYAVLDGARTLTATTMKAAQDPMRADSMAAVVAHAGVFRTFGFGLRLQSLHRFTDRYRFGATSPAVDAYAEAAARGVVPAADVFLDLAYSASAVRSNVENALATIAAKTL